MPPPALIVIGASAGGVEALRHVVAGLDPDIPAAIFVVLHIPPHGTSVLPAILKRAGRLPATHAVDGDPIEPARIYVAPPDFHLLIGDNRMFLRRGPQEHGTRPAVDPLFRTAAEAHGARVIGVVLSGMLDDGTSGLLAIKRHGGYALVQDPDNALQDGMPRSALATVEVDRVLPAAALGAELNELARLASEEREAKPPAPSAGARTENDTAERDVLEREGTLAGISCPHCAGSLWQVEEEGHVHFRCRVGHQYGTESLLAAQAGALEAALWTAVRSLEETSATARRLADRMGRIAPGKAVERHLRKAVQAEAHAAVIRRVLLSSERALSSE
jgi:two-component system, chemotaxis family, protein-glutamate methylesterase/glutaminase